MHGILRGSAVGFALFTLSFVAAVGATHGSEARKDAQGHVLVTISIGDGKKEPARQYQLVVAEGGEMARLFTGTRVPIPTTTFQSETAPAVPVTSFTYQNVGFTAQLRTWLRDGKIKVDANIEESRIAPGSSNASQPAVQASQQTFQALLTDGKPMRILRADDTAGKAGYVELKAEIVR